MYRMLLMFEVLLAVTRSEATDVPLNDFIGHFEALTYNENDLISSHERLKRTVGGEKHVELKFTALDKTFHFKLYPDASIFSNDFKLGVNGRPQRNADMTVYYSGKAVGDPGTSIRGDVSHGVFVGTITTPDEEYHIEPASHHFKEEQSFHSVIYRSSDVRFDALKGKTCGLSDHAIVKKMAEDQRKAVQETDPASHTVHKRQSPNRRLTKCKLFLIGDQRFYEAVSTSSFTEAQRVTQAKAFLSRAVARVNTIYEGTVFYNNVANSIGFEIAQVQIITEDTGFFAQNFIGVQAFLERHSRPQSGDQPFSVDFPSFCAVHRFTYRDFSNGVLGLAYVAPNNSNGGGGICSASLNTGIVSLLNFGRRVPENIHQLTFAHELGHNFGSGHDMRNNATCSPGSNGGSGGNFIMFESSSSGNDPNNDNFSPCSRTSMEAIISGRAQVGTRACFIEDPGDCGNGVLDSGEYCDCMFDYNDDTGLCNSDRCCNGSVCRLASGATCSPTVNTCCTTSCMATTDASFVCSPATECAHESRCEYPFYV